MKTHLLILLLLPLCLFSQNAEKIIDVEAIHPRNRNQPYPQNDEVVKINPVALLWAPIQAPEIKYSIQLSQSPSFENNKTIEQNNLPWAMFNSHKKLENGKWYWKYSATSKGKEIYNSSVQSFIVNDDAHILETPSVKDFVDIVNNKEHPRMLVTKDKLTDFRARNNGSIDAKKVIHKANKNLDQPLIEEAPTRPRDTTGLVGFEKQVMVRFMYHQFGEVVRAPIETQALAYLLTNDAKYAKEAIRQALHIAKMDPEGYATREDFNRASVMLGMATAFDVGYEFLSETEKKELIDAIKVRGDYFFKHYANNFEAHSMDNHVWQHTLRRFTKTAIAMSGHIDNADQWLAYTYEVWCSRFPILGGEDGGWHDGNSYYAVNFQTFIMIPLLLKNLTGVDFFDLPWYKNAGDYLIYSYPKNSYSTGFGDHFESQKKPRKRYIAYADALAREVKDTHAKAYANQLAAENENDLYDDKAFTSYRLLSNANDVESADLNSLPQAKVFRDAGFALMHTDLTNTPNNLMASFFGVPFGSSGHAHAAHNGFNISFGGEQMFGGSGYYSNFNDPHTLMHYRTRGHNTILVDGMAQVIGENGYGWIPRFGNTEKIGYALGDASHAYGDMTSEFWLDRMNKSNVEYTLENGFGNPKLKHFRRHFTLLRPNIIVIYDELEAEKEVSWTWLLHSQQKMRIENDIIYGENKIADAQVFLYSPAEIETDITDQFFSPAINWKQREEGGKVEEYKNNWHLYAKTKNKHRNYRFLAIIKINEKGGAEILKPKWQNGKIEIDDWTISAELDVSKKPRLEIKNSRGDALFYNTTDGHHRVKGSTILVSGETEKEELTDKLPLYR